MNIYLKYIRNQDITPKVVDCFINSLKRSVEFHEIKLFFIHQHFDHLTILQMNDLVDTLQASFRGRDYSTNPILNQYNTIKITLLYYRISFKIEAKNIYSLITKCFELNKYIMRSLDKYLMKQNHIAQLYKLIREPVFHLTERKDSLDLMLEMNMKELLNHPVIIEVINLVNEGQYSVDISVMNLSQTFMCLFQADTFSEKSVFDRMVKNIQNLGDDGMRKQCSLQFHIWKYNIEQRMQDEMLFTSILLFASISLIIIISNSFNAFMLNVSNNFGSYFFQNTALFLKATPE
jgi:hypothetical protein